LWGGATGKARDEITGFKSEDVRIGIRKRWMTVLRRVRGDDACAEVRRLVPLGLAPAKRKD